MKKAVELLETHGPLSCDPLSLRWNDPNRFQGLFRSRNSQPASLRTPLATTTGYFSTLPRDVIESSERGAANDRQRHGIRSRMCAAIVLTHLRPARGACGVRVQKSRGLLISSLVGAGFSFIVAALFYADAGHIRDF